MHNKACIVKIDGKNVWIAPLITDSCINCNHSSCAKRGSPFVAINTQKTPLQCGDIVSIKASAKSQFLQGLWSIIFPIASAIGGYFAAEHFITVHNALQAGSQHIIKNIEGIKALGVLSFLVIAVIAILLVNRFFLHLVKPEITAV